MALLFSFLEKEKKKKKKKKKKEKKNTQEGEKMANMSFPTFTGKQGKDALDFLGNFEIACVVSGRDDNPSKERIFPLLMKMEARTWYNALPQATKEQWPLLKTTFE